jgi:glycosyltransferase involved in cell wall biosynthesis
VKPIRVLHMITRLNLGGAQENTILSCALIDPARFPSATVSGTQIDREGEHFTMARARGVEVIPEPAMVREPNPVLDAVALGRLVALCRRWRPDVVHTHCSKAGILGRVAARMAGVRHVVHTAHGWGFHPAQSAPERLFYQAVERGCARLADTIVVVADQNRTRALELGIGRPEQFRTIRSGIELDAFRRDESLGRATRAALGIAPGTFVFGTVGRIAPQKAPFDALAAFARVHEANPDTAFVYVGDGPQHEELAAAVTAQGLAGKVHLLGLRHDVPALLSSFDAFVLTSRWEGLPRVVPQAMAAALPVIATAVDGTPEAVTEGVTGHLLAPGDVAGIADRMRAFAADPARARSLGAAGAARVEEFSARRMVDQLAELYAELCRR